MDSGKYAGSVVYNADSPIISRVFRHLWEIHPFSTHAFGGQQHDTYGETQPVGVAWREDPSDWVVRTDGAMRKEIQA
jgi:hypothetical protein